MAHRPSSLKSLLDLAPDLRRLGPFLLVRPLGRGSFAPVWLAKEMYGATELRTVAVKLFSLEAPDSELAPSLYRSRVIDEARALCQVEHPCIVRFYALPTDDARGVMGLAMEYAAGTPLDRRLAETGRLSIAETLLVGARMAAALEAVHRTGLVHRDVKPANIVEADGAYKLIDFGIAAADAPGKEGGATKVVLYDDLPLEVASMSGGRIAGTVGYIDPVCVATGAAAAPASDLYALGATLFECLTGKLPAAAGAARSGLDGAVLEGREPAPPLLEIVPDAPPELARLIDSMLAPERRDRPGSAEQVAIALDRARRGLEAPPARRGRALGIAAGVALAALAGALAWHGKGSAPPATAAGPSVSATPAPTALTDLPLPPSTSPAAIAEYRRGLAMQRNGNSPWPAYRRALELDPELTVVHLQFVWLGITSTINDEVREHFRLAEERRASLGERDQALLDAFEPVLRRQPSDWAESLRRMEAASLRFPGDAQIVFDTGVIAGTASSELADGLADSLSYLERACALDPGYASPRMTIGEYDTYLGRFEDARRAFDRCPESPGCLSARSDLLEHEGACEEQENAARDFIAANPTHPLGYLTLAKALAARGRSPATVREALKQRWATAPDTTRAALQAADELALDLLAGDFTSAEARARAAAGAAEESRLEQDHAGPARILVQILVESGRAPEAGRVATDFLSRHDAWEPDARAEDYSIAGDATPEMLVAARRAGLISRGELAIRRDEWLRNWRRKAPKLGGFLWPHGWAATVDSPDDAREALTAKAHFPPISPFLPKTLAEAAVGATYLHAGQLDEAVAWLERATRTCRVLELPIEHTRAHLSLGRAREAQGDKAGACAAYKVVLERWGEAKPTSVTLEKARERAKALACGG